MSERSNSLEDPDQIRDATGERRDGRPVEAELDPERPGPAPDAVPTVAPEEEGSSPSTEHAPGGDL